ncbi:hypothetical protein FGO68_gene16964 [Halteria grandinella]|uniref:Uncharacterized protein n=1 Tax=Halteria grandinella TaxID=5974 RepID=A0A8J8NFL4_HALGN|nr:hypothetical protein FGO68_gene16964 [Halteria grandinella]
MQSGTGECNENDGTEELKQMRTKYLLETFTSVIKFYPILAVMFALKDYYNGYKGPQYMGVAVVAILQIVTYTLKKFLEQGGSRQTFVETKGYFIMMFLSMALFNEWFIQQSPHQYKVRPEQELFLIQYVAFYPSLQ